jgi:hypothetical protein
MEEPKGERAKRRAGRRKEREKRDRGGGGGWLRVARNPMWVGPDS